MKRAAPLRVMVSRKASRIFWTLVAAVWLSAYVATIVGQRLDVCDGTVVTWYDWLNYAYLAVGVFGVLWEFPALASLDSTSHWLLHVARWLGPIAAASTVLWLLLERVRTWMALALYGIRPPDVLCLGMSAEGRVLMRMLAQRFNSTIVAVDDREDIEVEDYCDRNAITLFTADTADVRALRRLPLNRTRVIVVAAESDAKTLQIANAVETLLRKKRYARSAPGLYIHLNDPLLQRTFRDSSVTSAFEMVSIPSLVAHDLIIQAQLCSLADERGQDRVHVVVEGLNVSTLELLATIGQAAVRSDMGKPSITIMTEHVADLGEQICTYTPEVHNWLDIYIQKRPPSADALITQLTNAAGDRGRITSFVIAADNDAEAIVRAISIYAIASADAEIDAPVIVISNKLTIPIALLRQRSETNLLGAAFEAVGAGSLNADGVPSIGFGSDASARLLHERYLERTRGSNVNTAGSASSAWDTLGGTYRESNRRAAAHLPSKLRQAGFAPRSNTGNHVDKIRIDHRAAALALSRQREDLAHTEHLRWCVDRTSLGWRYGTSRNNTRRLHNLLVSYADLNELARDFDRLQVADVFGVVSAQDSIEPNWLPELWFGVAGSLRMTQDECDLLNPRIEEIFTEVANALPFQFKVAIVTPAAPGADVLLTQAITRLLNDKKIESRLIVLEPAPREQMAKDWESIIDNRAEYLSQLEALQNRARWVVPLHHRWPPGSMDMNDKSARESGYQLASAYLAMRCDVLLVAAQKSRPGNQGGSVELFQWRDDPSRIPSQFRFRDRSTWLRRSYQL